MKVVIAGGSGFIGQHLADLLKQKGHEVIIWDIRTPQKSYPFLQIDLVRQEPRADLFEGVHAVIHLAGKNIFGRWNEKLKREIYDSRIKSTRNVVGAMGKLEQKPKVLVSASAVGFCGDRREAEIDENVPPGKDFLAKVCVDWEEEARRAEDFGVRTVQIRTAPVLGKRGLLKILVPLYKLGLGGPIGSGEQWFPWIHIQDIIHVYLFALENERLRGPVNAAAPEQIRNKEFSNTLAKVLHRPAFLRVPLWALRILTNDFADSIATSQKVIPRKLQTFGYKFQFPTVQNALENILSKSL